MLHRPDRKMSRSWCSTRHSALAVVILLVSCFKTAFCCSVINNGTAFTTAVVHTDNTSPEGTVVATFQSANVSRVAGGNSFIEVKFDTTTGEITLVTTKAFESYEISNTASSTMVLCTVMCKDTTGQISLQVNVDLTLKNKYAPIFITKDLSNVSDVQVNVLMPLHKSYTVVGGCDFSLQAIDYGLDSDYLTFTVDGGGGSYAVSSTRVQIGTKYGYQVTLSTAKLLDFEQPQDITLTATDGGSPPKSTYLEVTLTPNLTDSTPPNPWFSQPLYSAEITETMTSGNTLTFDTDITISEGYDSSMKLTLVSTESTDWSTTFSVHHTDKVVQIRLAETPTEELLNKPFLALLIKANRDNAVKEGRAVVLLTLPGSKPVTTTTSRSTMTQLYRHE